MDLGKNISSSSSILMLKDSIFKMETFIFSWKLDNSSSRSSSKWASNKCRPTATSKAPSGISMPFSSPKLTLLVMPTTLSLFQVLQNRKLKISSTSKLSRTSMKKEATVVKGTIMNGSPKKQLKICWGPTQQQFLQSILDRLLMSNHSDLANFSPSTECSEMRLLTTLIWQNFIKSKVLWLTAI